jgi:ADP-heptose:LPS heptosyltransferase
VKISYLPIRAFGDFIITASIVKDNFLSKIPIILPDYFNEIFYAIDAGNIFEIHGTGGYKNQPAFFELYKVKDLKNLKRLINDVRTFNDIINKKDQYIVDYSSRRLAFTGANLIWPPKKQNVYEGRLKLFSDLNLIKQDRLSANLIQSAFYDKNSRILILPDSRIDIKRINIDLINSIVNEFKQIEIKVAHFSTKTKSENDFRLYYSNFTELITLISSFDMVISAESLPYHLANFLKKPHFVIYNQSRHFDPSFMTPFMVAHKYYSFFTGDNNNQIIADLSEALFAD